MLKFLKSNKMFATAVALAITLVMGICYGFAARNDSVVVLGSVIAFGAVAYIMLSIAVDKELASN